MDKFKVNNLNYYLNRPLNNSLVNELKEKIEQNGFYEYSELLVAEHNDREFVVAGNHRLAAAKKLELEEIPGELVDTPKNNWDKVAIRDNKVNKTLREDDLFDWLYRIEKWQEDGLTQKEMGKVAGWSRSKISQYKILLNNIATRILELAKKHQEGRVAKNATNVANFTEGWFRTSGIYNLNKNNQLKFMKWFCGKQKCNTKKSKIKQKSKELLLKEQARYYLDKNLHKKADGSGIIDNINKGLYNNLDQVKNAVSSLNEQAIEKEKIQILNQDAFEMLSEQPDNSVDAIITDPPYNVTDNDWDKFDSDGDFLNFIEKLIIKSKRVLKDKYHFYLFTADKYLADIEMLFRKYDLPIKSRIIWVRKNMSMGRTSNKKFISHYEPIFHIGNKSLNFPKDWGEERFNVQEFAVPQSNFDDKKEHPTQKPYHLIKRLVELSTDIGDMVIDPFCGAGTTAKACDALNRKCITSDISEKYIEVAKKRVFNIGR